MLLIALAIVAVLWLGTALVMVGLCASAAAGDRALRRRQAPPERAELLRIA